MKTRFEKQSNMSDFFLIAGVPKAGTSWLWHNLKQYDEIFLTPKKEIFYFDRSYKYPTPSFFAEQNYIKRILGNTQSSIETRQEVKKLIRWSIQEKSFLKFLYYMRYILGAGNIKWYKNLINQGADKMLCGEASTTYCILEKEEIREIAHEFSNVKVIIILRNPIERTWSNIKYKHMKKRNVDISDENSIKNYIYSDINKCISNYPRIINNWESVLGKQNVNFLLHDNIKSDAYKFIKKVIMFLGEGRIEFQKDLVIKQKRNTSFDLEMPTYVKNALYKLNEENISYLKDELGYNVGRWLQARY